MTSRKLSAPIRVRCEGSGCPPAGHSLPIATAWRRHPGSGMCSMCGQTRALIVDGVMPEHDRDDLLAMIDRGDFDER